MSKTIRLAIAGMGNCASSLVQGIEFYKDADPSESVPGLMHVELGGYHVPCSSLSRPDHGLTSLFLAKLDSSPLFGP